MNVVIIGCGKSKRDVESAARDLYTGSLFVACRRYAEASGCGWAILSAQGLVMPNWELFPYDAKLSLRGTELENWAMNAAKKARLLLNPSNVVCLAGVTYARPFAAALECLSITCEQPLAGMGIGQRLRWLSEHTHASAAE
jgi:hypothetical protein